MPSLDSEGSEYQTLPTTTISVSGIEEITRVSQMVMFPDGYSRGISTWLSHDDSVDCTFHDMVEGFPRLEEFWVWENQNPIPVRVREVCPLPVRVRNPIGWGHESLEAALWNVVPLVMVSGQQAVCSSGHPKSFYHPY